MLGGNSHAFAFGPFRLFPAARRLEREEKQVRLGGRALDLLTFLVERAGDVVPHRTLLENIWRDINVEDSSLRFHIRSLRGALGDEGTEARYVANVPGRGYCFVAPVKRLENADVPTARHRSLGFVNNLPSRLSVIVGRAQNLAALTHVVSQHRLVTITGPAGIGKTTLAVATAQDLRTRFDDSAMFVDFAPVKDPARVVPTLASILRIPQSAEEPILSIVDALIEQKLLLLLDNCEQVVESIAEMVDYIIRYTAAVHIIVTSREPLRIGGESVHRLMPLEYPGANTGISASQALAYGAVQLFAERAAAGAGSFSLDDASAPAAVEICRRLDGIPLAIELAAARVEFFGVQGLAKVLNDMFAVLTLGRRFALPRQQTLRATLDWGYNLLSATEKTVLGRISVFQAAFTGESALAVVVGPDLDRGEATDSMTNLVAKSLLGADRSAETIQYRLLEATRLYASEKLAASDEARVTRRRHAEHHLELIRSASLGGELSEAKHWLKLYAGRIDDVRVAIEWAFSPGGEFSIGLNLIADSGRLWFQLSLTSEYRERIESILHSKASELDPWMEMRLQSAMGHALWYTSSAADVMERAFGRALELAEQVGDRSVQSQALWGKWATRRLHGRYAEALELANKYAQVAEKIGDPSLMSLGDRILGLTHHYLGNQLEAAALLQRVRSSARETKSAPKADFQLDPEVATTTLLTRILWLRGFPEQAAAMLRTAIDAAKRSDHSYSLGYVLGIAGCPLCFWIGDLKQAQDYLDVMAEADAGNPTLDKWRRRWSLILRLRRGDENDVQSATYYEPRLDMSESPIITAFTSMARDLPPSPTGEVDGPRWSAAECLRVDAELTLSIGSPGSASIAELYLLRAIDLARRQSALAWELRAVSSLARLWRHGPRASESRDLLAATCDQFGEGSATRDVVEARRLLAEYR